MNFKTKTLSYEDRARIFWSLIIVSCLCLIVYVVAVNYTVRNTVARQTLEVEEANRAALIGDLEFSYIAMKNKVSLDLAYSRGFKEVKSPTYISQSASRVLTFNR